MTSQNLNSLECIKSNNKHIDNSNAFISSNKINPYAAGILNDLTFAVKDNIDIAGKVTGYGSPCWAMSHPKAISNALCIDQLLSEGASCIGKTISDELAYSLIGINPFYGTPLNPKAPDRVPGGSSSGSASAVACGLADFALGTDTGGSVRVPASNCGIWGYRPSHGAILNSGTTALAPSFDTVGVLAKNGRTLRQVINVLLGSTAECSSPSPNIYFVSDVFNQCDMDVIDMTNGVIARLSNHYHTYQACLADLTEKQIDSHWLFELFGYSISAEVWNTFGPWVTAENPELSQALLYNLENYAKPINRKDIQKWMLSRCLFRKKLNGFLNKDNILCFPTTPTLAPEIKEVTTEFIRNGDYYPKSMGINAISGLSGTPQITIPITSPSNNTPLGLSFLAGYGCDTMLADFCVALTKLNLNVEI